MKAIRYLLGMTQKQFGSDLGIPNPQVQVAMMESDRRIISKRLSRAICLMVDNWRKEKAMAKAGVQQTE